MTWHLIRFWHQKRYVQDLRPWARSTTSAVFLFHTPSHRDRKLLFDNYGSAFADFTQFCQIFQYITAEPHTAMVLLLNNGSTNLLDNVFWFRGSADTNDFKICHPALWAYALERTDESRTKNVTLMSCHSGDDK